jgi:hypothetical protein
LRYHFIADLTFPRLLKKNPRILIKKRKKRKKKRRKKKNQRRKQDYKEPLAHHLYFKALEMKEVNI